LLCPHSTHRTHICCLVLLFCTVPYGLRFSPFTTFTFGCSAIFANNARLLHGWHTFTHGSFTHFAATTFGSFAITGCAHGYCTAHALVLFMAHRLCFRLVRFALTRSTLSLRRRTRTPHLDCAFTVDAFCRFTVWFAAHTCCIFTVHATPGWVTVTFAFSVYLHTYIVCVYGSPTSLLRSTVCVLTTVHTRARLHVCLRSRSVGTLFRLRLGFTFQFTRCRFVGLRFPRIPAVYGLLPHGCGVTFTHVVYLTFPFCGSLPLRSFGCRVTRTFTCVCVRWLHSRGYHTFGYVCTRFHTGCHCFLCGCTLPVGSACVVYVYGLLVTGSLHTIFYIFYTLHAPFTHSAAHVLPFTHGCVHNIPLPHVWLRFWLRLHTTPLWFTFLPDVPRTRWFTQFYFPSLPHSYTHHTVLVYSPPGYPDLTVRAFCAFTPHLATRLHGYHVYRAHALSHFTLLVHITFRTPRFRFTVYAWFASVTLCVYAHRSLFASPRVHVTPLFSFGHGIFCTWFALLVRFCGLDLSAHVHHRRGFVYQFMVHGVCVLPGSAHYAWLPLPRTSLLSRSSRCVLVFVSHAARFRLPYTLPLVLHLRLPHAHILHTTARHCVAWFAVHAHSRFTHPHLYIHAGSRLRGSAARASQTRLPRFRGLRRARSRSFLFCAPLTPLSLHALVLSLPRTGFISFLPRFLCWFASTHTPHTAGFTTTPRHLSATHRAPHFTRVCHSLLVLTFTAASCFAVYHTRSIYSFQFFYALLCVGWFCGCGISFTGFTRTGLHTPFSHVYAPLSLTCGTRFAHLFCIITLTLTVRISRVLAFCGLARILLPPARIISVPFRLLHTPLLVAAHAHSSFHTHLVCSPFGSRSPRTYTVWLYRRYTASLHRTFPLDTHYAYISRYTFWIASQFSATCTPLATALLPRWFLTPHAVTPHYYVLHHTSHLIL